MKRIKINWWIVLIITFLASIPIIVEWAMNNIPSQSDLCKQGVDSYRNLVYSGKVIEKFIDVESHLDKTVIVWEDNMKRKILLDEDIGGVYDYISVGDSLIKNKGDLFVLINRDGNDTIIEFKFRCY